MLKCFQQAKKKSCYLGGERLYHFIMTHIQDKIILVEDELVIFFGKLIQQVASDFVDFVFLIGII